MGLKYFYSLKKNYEQSKHIQKIQEDNEIGDDKEIIMNMDSCNAIQRRVTNLSKNMQSEQHSLHLTPHK